MLEEELVQLVNKIISEKCEKQHIELKKASGGTPSKLYDTLSSFSNQIGGGIIVFGIDEDAGYVGDSDQPMTEYEIYSYEAFKRRIHDELRTVDRATMEYLGTDNMIEYLIKLRRQKVNLINLDDERIMETQGISQEGLPTLAGLMLLGEYPQEFFPQLSVTAMVVQGREIGELGEDGERFIDNKRIEGTISQMLEGTLAFVRRNMKVKTIITEDGVRADRPEYPIKAVREIIMNALIHRDYSVHTERSPVRLVMYEDRLELENPGGLYGRITIDDLGKAAADTRNPYLAGALEIMIDTENRFSGIPTVIAELNKANLPAPVFIDKRGVFKVIFYKKSVVQSKDTDFEQEILNYCITPRSREELAEKFRFEAPSYFIKTYISPLVEEGKIKMTIPDKPKSKFQKYFSQLCIDKSKSNKG